jgi:hypothetical protein
MTRTCKHCPVVDTVTETGAAALGHDWEYEAGATEPTCEDDGHGSRKCKRCPLRQDNIVFPKLGHEENDEWYTTLEPTNIVDGSKELRCIRFDCCGYVFDTESIPAIPLVINNVTILITPPAKGEAPDTDPKTDDTQYTFETVVWSYNGNTFLENAFLGNTVYTVTITLNTTAGYTFYDGLNGDIKINGEDVTTKGIINATEAEVSFTFPATQTKEVEAIAIHTQPASMVFVHGNEFTPQNLKATITYTDKTTEEVAFADFSQHSIFTYPVSIGLELNRTTHDDKEITVGIGSVTPAVITARLVVNKADPAMPATPVENTKSYNSITVNVITPLRNDQTIEYGFNTSNTLPAAWQDTPVFSGLNYATTYHIFARVRGDNNYNTGAASSVQITTLATVPSVPQNFTATGGGRQVELSWAAPTSTGGSNITRYEVSINGGSWVTAASNTAHTFTGLDCETSYNVNVRAVNSIGNGTAASTSESTLGHAAGAPATCTTAQVCTRVGCTHVIVSALGHDWDDDDWEETRAATCMVGNEETRTCTRNCGLEGHTQTQSTVAALGHDWDETIHATCTTDSIPGDCTRCGDSNNPEEVVPVLGHDRIGMARTSSTITSLTSIPVTGTCSRGCTGIASSVTLVQYIEEQTAEPVFLPIQIDLGTMAVGSGWTQLLDVLHAAGKNIALDLSASTRSFSGAFTTVTGTTAASVPNGMHNIVSIVLPNTTVTWISDNAFRFLTNLTSITIPNSVIHIGDDAFHSTGLTSIVLPNSVTTIRSGTFANCTSLTTIVIPDSVTTIGEFAFAFCTGLTSIVLPNSVTTIGSEAFRNTGLTSITIPDSVTRIGQRAFQNTGIWNNTPNNEVVYADKWAVGVRGSVSGSLTLRADTVGIGDWTFFNSTSLTSVTIPDSVTRIGHNAFSGCTGLTSITIPDSVTTIGDFAFSGCTGLTSVIIGSGVTSIGFGAFRDCTSLESITIPFVGGTPTTETMRLGRTFGDVNNRVPASLRTVIITGGDSIPNEAFYRCTGLTSITIPNSVTRIGWDAFSGCTGLTSITIPNSVTTIATRAFQDCTGLTTITIPNSVTSIGNNAFQGCTGLTSVTLRRFISPNTITTLGINAFNSTHADLIIKVPAAGVNAYRAANNWSNAALVDRIVADE